MRFAWSWLGAALEATPGSYATVCAPGDRYHPAVIAPAAAALSEMYHPAVIAPAAAALSEMYPG